MSADTIVIIQHVKRVEMLLSLWISFLARQTETAVRDTCRTGSKHTSWVHLGLMVRDGRLTGS